MVVPTPTPTPPSTGGIAMAGATAVAGVVGSYTAAKQAEAQGYYQQAANLVQAQENMRMSGLRADKEVEYAELSAARKIQQVEFDSINYKIQTNYILRQNAKANASARARAAANGIAYGEGSAAGVQTQNVLESYRDVGIADLSSLMSRVFGMEDATQILRAGYDSAFYTREAAVSNTRAMQKAGKYAVSGASLIADAKLFQGGLEFMKVFPFEGVKGLVTKA
jgi:hypothetical protein